MARRGLLLRLHSSHTVQVGQVAQMNAGFAARAASRRSLAPNELEPAAVKGSEISGHIWRLTRTGERVVRHLHTERGVLVALTAGRTKLVNKVALAHIELVEMVPVDDARNPNRTPCLFHVRILGKSRFFQALTLRDAQLWAETLRGLADAARANPELVREAEKLAMSYDDETAGTRSSAAHRESSALLPIPRREVPAAARPIEPAMPTNIFMCCDTTSGNDRAPRSAAAQPQGDSCSVS